MIGPEAVAPKGRTCVCLCFAVGSPGSGSDGVAREQVVKEGWGSTHHLLPEGFLSPGPGSGDLRGGQVYRKEFAGDGRRNSVSKAERKESVEKPSGETIKKE